MYVIRPYYGKVFYKDNDRNAFQIQCTVKTVGVGFFFFVHFVPYVKEHLCWTNRTYILSLDAFIFSLKI